MMSYETKIEYDLEVLYYRGAAYLLCDDVAFDTSCNAICKSLLQNENDVIVRSCYMVW